MQKSNLNACWEALRPQVVAPDSMVLAIEERITSIVTLSQELVE